MSSSPCESGHSFQALNEGTLFCQACGTFKRLSDVVPLSVTTPVRPKPASFATQAPELKSKRDVVASDASPSMEVLPVLTRVESEDFGISDYSPVDMHEATFMSEWRLLTKKTLTVEESQLLSGLYGTRDHATLTSMSGALDGEKASYRDFMTWLVRPNGIIPQQLKVGVIRKYPVWQMAVDAITRRNGPLWAGHAEQVLYNRHRNKKPKARRRLSRVRHRTDSKSIADALVDVRETVNQLHSIQRLSNLPPSTHLPGAGMATLLARGDAPSVLSTVDPDGEFGVCVSAPRMMVGKKRKGSKVLQFV